MEEAITSKDNAQFRIELILALILSGLACAAGFSNLLYISNDFYPATSDAMGHMAKVRYLAECFSSGEFPSWFPYWYNGTTITQYYPPLSYWLMALIFMAVKNAMLTFKIYCFSMIFIGGTGVWYFCRSFIGRWCGIFGMLVFCLQPYILKSLFGAGTVAQGPIIALIPWYLLCLLAYSQRPNARKFLLCTLICALMILGHPNTTFMMCLCIMAVFFIFVLIQRTTFLNFIYVGLTIVFAGVMTAFWSFVGVTGLETPGIPYLLVEAALIYTADINWYTTLSGSFFYFAVPVSAGFLISLLLFSYRASKKIADEWEWDKVLFCILITFVTIVFSFGLNLPLFQYLPLAESYVPGRILGLTSASGAILCAYLVYMIQRSAQENKMGIKITAFITCAAIIGTILYSMNPLKAEYGTISSFAFDEMILKTSSEGSNFEKGRYAYIGVVDSSETYYPLTYDFNITDGWNIEGTPHNLAIWNQVIAYPSECYLYIAKNLAFWNIRELLLDEQFAKVSKELNEVYSFQYVGKKGELAFYTSDYPSSYFLTDRRNALLLGAGSPGLAMEFPYLVHEQRNDIFDYSMEELERYRLIYLCEPAVNSLEEKESIEEMVKELTDKGVTVLIEPTITKGYQLFDVAVSEVSLEDAPTIRKQTGSKIDSTADNIIVDESMRYGRAMFGLDKVYYTLVQNGGRLENEIIGTKKVGNGEVVFIGKHLSQYLKAVYARNWGVPDSESGYPACSDDVKALFTDIFQTYGVNTDFWPEPFPVKSADWNYKGVDFKYSSPKAQEMTLSVTYTPRWKATLDGNPIAVGQKENLITIDLPKGDHQMKLVYGLTKYGIAGYIISLAGLLLFVLFFMYYGIIIYRFRQISQKISRFLQLTDIDHKENEDTGDINAERL